MSTSPDNNHRVEAENQQMLDMALSRDEIDRARELPVSHWFTETVGKLVAGEVNLNLAPTDAEQRIVSTDTASKLK